MIAVRDDARGGLGVREPAPLLPTEQLVEASSASRREKRHRPPRGDLALKLVHRSSTHAFALALRIGSHGFDVTRGAPLLFTELDSSRYSARVADETIPVARQHVHTAVGVFGVIVAEPVAEGTVPERPQAQAGRGVNLVALDYDDVRPSM